MRVLMFFFFVGYATLTEPTSLKMMRPAKDDEQLHLDVSKPSQVCFPYLHSPAPSRLLASPLPLHNSLRQPKPQRQGEIVVLGMLALSRRSVVTEHR